MYSFHPFRALVMKKAGLFARAHPNIIRIYDFLYDLFVAFASAIFFERANSTFWQRLLRLWFRSVLGSSLLAVLTNLDVAAPAIRSLGG